MGDRGWGGTWGEERGRGKGKEQLLSWLAVIEERRKNKHFFLNIENKLKKTYMNTSHTSQRFITQISGGESQLASHICPF